MANKIYRWVGGLRGQGLTFAAGVTSSSSIEIFNWNNEYNWEEYIKQPNGKYKKSFGRVPSQKDDVLFGTFSLPVVDSVVDAPEKVYSPCLYGGYSGSSISGTWFTTQNTPGIPALGTTYTSNLKSFTVLNEGEKRYSDTYVNYNLGSFAFPLGGGIAKETLSINLSFINNNFPNIASGLTWNSGWTGSFFNNYTPYWDNITLKSSAYNISTLNEHVYVNIKTVPNYSPIITPVSGVTYSGGYTGSYAPVINTSLNASNAFGVMINGGYFKNIVFSPRYRISNGKYYSGGIDLFNLVAENIYLPLNTASSVEGVTCANIVYNHNYGTGLPPGATTDTVYSSTFRGSVGYNYASPYIYPNISGVSLEGQITIKSSFEAINYDNIPGVTGYNQFIHHRAISEYDFIESDFYSDSLAVVPYSTYNKKAFKLLIGDNGVQSGYNNIKKISVSSESNYLPHQVIIIGDTNIDYAEIGIGGRIASENNDSDCNIGYVEVNNFGTLDMRVGKFDLGVAGATSTSGGAIGEVNGNGRILISDDDRLFNINSIRKGTIDARISGTGTTYKPPVSQD